MSKSTATTLCRPWIKTKYLNFKFKLKQLEWLLHIHMILILKHWVGKELKWFLEQNSYLSNKPVVLVVSWQLTDVVTVGEYQPCILIYNQVKYIIITLNINSFFILFISETIVVTDYKMSKWLIYWNQSISNKIARYTYCQSSCMWLHQASSWIRQHIYRCSCPGCSHTAECMPRVPRHTRSRL